MKACKIEPKPSSCVKNVHVEETEEPPFRNPLFESVLARDKERVVELIEAGSDVNSRDDEGKTALFYAAQQNNESVVRALVDGGADVNRTDNEGKTALFYAVQGNSESMVRVLIEEGNSLTSLRDIYGRTPLFYAMTSNSQSLVCYFLEKKINMKIKDNGGMNFLSFFVDHCISKPTDSHDDHKSLVSDILGLLVQKEVKSNTIYKAIIDIVFCKCPLLFYPGINVPVFIHFLELAKTYGKENNTEIDSVLEKARKIMNDKALCADLVPQILDMLYELGADPNSADANGNTALHHVVCLPFHGVSIQAIMDLLTKLEEGGVTVDAKNHQSETPLLFCLTLRRDNQLVDESNYLMSIKALVEVSKFLIKNGSNVEETTKKGETVLHLIISLLQQILEWNGNRDITHAVQVGNELFVLFSSTRAGTRVVNNKDENLNSPLHLWASLELPCQCSENLAYKRSVFSDFLKEILKKLVVCGTHLEERNKQGQTPLHLCRTWAAVKLLLDEGAKPNVVDSEGRSPLIVATQSKIFLKASKTSFYPDVTIAPKRFWKISLEKGLVPWIIDEHDNSVLSSLIESEAYELTMAMIDVGSQDGYLKPEDISTCLSNVCKNSAAHLYWKSSLVNMMLKSSDLQSVEICLPLDLCCRNIVESSKTLSNDEVKKTVHWVIAKQLLPHAADFTIQDIAKNYPELKDLLEIHDISDPPAGCLPWVNHSERYRPTLEKVSRHQESKSVKSYWYHIKHIAVGSFGLVFAGINQLDGREVAIKRIEKLRMKRPEDKREISTLSALESCEHVVQYFSFFEDENFSYIILELMEGNLDDYLDIPENVAMNSISLCKDLVKGLQYLHSLNIVHRDLKPSNILFKAYPNLSLKIADFGLSHYVAGSTSTSAYASLAGTRCWMAPELLMCTGAVSEVCSKWSDMFSCGLLLHYILSVKNHPFAPADCANKSAIQISNETEANVMNGNMEGWDVSLCPEAAHLLKMMLDGDKGKRPSANKALVHPFFWTNTKKLDLLIAVGDQPEFECPRAKRTLPLTAVDLETSFGTIVAYMCWNDPHYTHMPAIYTEMTKKRKPYDTHSVVELVRFIRNAIAHVSDCARPTAIRKQILEDFVFLEYFPNLVSEVYKAVTTHGWDQREEIEYAIEN